MFLYLPILDQVCFGYQGLWSVPCGLWTVDILHGPIANLLLLTFLDSMDPGDPTAANHSLFDGKAAPLL